MPVRRMIASMAVFAVLATMPFLAGCSVSAGQDGTDKATEGSSSQVESSELKTYVITRVDGEPDWESVPQVDLEDQGWVDPTDVSAHAQLCYDDEAIYVRMWAEEEDIRAEYAQSDLLANTYEDSCLELFIQPIEGDARYLNFEFNPNCAVGAEIGTQKTGRTRIVPTEDPYQAVSERTDDGWMITYQLPFEYLQTFYPDFSPESGTQMRGNFYKCGDLTASKHYLAWNPVDSETPNFHLPDSFGVLVFE